ncbi:MAG: enoyl-ACP reductase FabI [Alphaproteobacteria bacterium]
MANVIEKKNNLMEGKRGIIMGVANNRSIAWGIAKSLREAGAEIALTYQGEVLAKRIFPLAESLGSTIVLPCDVLDESSVESVFDTLKKEWGTIDFVVHAIAYSDKEELKGEYFDTTRQNFLQTMDISCFSLTNVMQKAFPLMKDNGGSVVTLSYLGAERVLPHYNVMGVAKAALEASVRYLAADVGKHAIRVNSISAGPLKTLAAAGIGDFRYIFKWNEHNAPLRRNTTLEDVGGSALYLLSDLGSGTTGENLHVDSGYHVVGMKALDAPDLTLPKD